MRRLALLGCLVAAGVAAPAAAHGPFVDAAGVSVPVRAPSGHRVAVWLPLGHGPGTPGAPACGCAVEPAPPAAPPRAEPHGRRWRVGAACGPLSRYRKVARPAAADAPEKAK